MLSAAENISNTLLEILAGRALVTRKDLSIEVYTSGTVKLENGDILSTSSDSKMKLVFPCDAVLIITGNMELAIRMDGVRIKKGRTWIFLGKKGKKFEAITPTGTIGIRGTTVLVTVDEFERTRLDVLEGAVTLTVGTVNREITRNSSAFISRSGTVYQSGIDRSTIQEFETEIREFLFPADSTPAKNEFSPVKSPSITGTGKNTEDGKLKFRERSLKGPFEKQPDEIILDSDRNNQKNFNSVLESLEILENIDAK